MKLSEAIEKLKKLQDWYKEGNMSTTIETSELEALCVVLQALEELQKENHRLKNWKQYKEIRKMRRTDEAIEKARKYFAEKELLKGE